MAKSTSELKYEARVKTFLAEYLKDMNGARAYNVVWPKNKSPETAAAQLLAKPAVKKMLAERVEPVIKQAEVQIDDLIRETLAQAFLNPMDYMTIDDDGRPKIDLNKCKDKPEIMRLLKIKFGVNVTKDGDKVHTYEVSTYDKDVAMERLFKLKRLYAAGEGEDRGRPIFVNVNFPIPASGWRSATKPAIDAEPVEE